MKRQSLKKRCFLFVLGACLFISCDGKKEVTGILPTAPTEPTTQTPAAPVHVFYGSYQVVNGGFYETLMKTCARCGTKRLINTTFGTRYEKYWSFGESLKECTNWLNEGLLQLEFAEFKLPTSVKVSFQPKYRGSSDQLGWPFELEAEARPINNNEGFEILISPNQGLGGVHNLILSSNSSSPVKQSDLSVNIRYGPQAQIIAHPTLKKYVARWIAESPYACGEYPPSL